MKFSRSFVRFNWVALVLIYLIFVAGSLVRITGSGMGCPDWPKCFGEWIPPTSAEELPENYKEIYSDIRAKKLDKFTKLLERMGMKMTADKMRSDPSILQEQDFNAKKTWTEYFNRLVGFLAGNALLALFVWIMIKYRKRKLIVLSVTNLIITGITAWLGSIVVASNLVPWVITLHMMLGLAIIGIQLYIIRMVSPSQQVNLPQTSWMRWLITLVFAVTLYQMFLGTQVRESIDELTKLGFNRNQWVDELGWPFYIHRSFSWAVLVILAVIAWFNEQSYKYTSIRWVMGLLIVELVSGVLLAHIDMPGIVQTAHLIFASAIFGILMMLVFRSKRKGIA
jgi:cytochrome c oxidase assembly protein subunit 15